MGFGKKFSVFSSAYRCFEVFLPLFWVQKLSFKDLSSIHPWNVEHKWIWALEALLILFYLCLQGFLIVFVFIFSTQEGAVRRPLDPGPFLWGQGALGTWRGRAPPRWPLPTDPLLHPCFLGENFPPLLVFFFFFSLIGSSHRWRYCRLIQPSVLLSDDVLNDAHLLVISGSSWYLICLTWCLIRKHLFSLPCRSKIPVLTGLTPR